MVSILAVWTVALLLAPAWAGAAGHDVAPCEGAPATVAQCLPDARAHRTALGSDAGSPARDTVTDMHARGTVLVLAGGDTAHDAHAGHRTHDARASGGELVVPVHLISAAGVHESIGTIVLRDGADGLTVVPDLRGITPGRHAFHIHENGSCEPGVDDGKMVAGLAAGPHYGHGAHEGHGGKPAGDLPELVAGTDGTATETVTSGHLALSEVAGRSIMIHAHGEAEAPGGGPRMACGVIPDPHRMTDG